MIEIVIKDNEIRNLSIAMMMNCTFVFGDKKKEYINTIKDIEFSDKSTITGIFPENIKFPEDMFILILTTEKEIKIYKDCIISTKINNYTIIQTSSSEIISLGEYRKRKIKTLLC